MKKFFSIFLSFFIFIFLFVTLIFNAVIRNVNKSTIIDTAIESFGAVSEVQKNDSGLFYPEDKIIKQAGFNSFDLENGNLSAMIQEFIKESDVDIQLSDEMTRKFLEDSDTKKFINTFTDEIEAYITGKSEKLDVPAKDFKKVVDKSISLYEKETGESLGYEINEEELEEIFSESIKEIQESLDMVKENNEEIITAYNLFMKFFSPAVLMILIGIIIVLFVIIFLINMNIFTAFAYASIPAIISGLFVFIIGLPGKIITKELAYYSGIGYEKIINLVSGILEGFFRTCLVSGLITFFAGVVLCVIGFVFKSKIGSGKKTDKI